MASELFELAADRLEEQTDLDRLEARGTLRIALKKAGVDPEGCTFAELEAVFARVMPSELAERGTTDGAAVCDLVLKSLPRDLSGTDGDAAASRDEIMRRLASS